MNIFHILKFLQSDSGVGGILYECVRCSIIVSLEELDKLPEIKCICGYRILKKIRKGELSSNDVSVNYIKPEKNIKGSKIFPLILE